MLIKCYHCHIEFNRKPSEISPNCNFCCMGCKRAAHKQDKTLNSNYRGGHDVPCDNCGKKVYLTPSKKKNSKNHFCSRNCQGSWASRNLVGEKASNYKGAKHKSCCQFCEKEFESFAIYNRQFCSYECKSLSQKKINVLICDNCNKEYTRRDCEIHWSSQRKYKHNFCSRECNGTFYREENHPNWIEDRSKLKSEVRSLRYSFKMKEWRNSVFARDNYTCLKCENRSSKGNPVILNAHHIKKFADFPDLRFDINNGATLCVPCHDEVTGKEVEFEKIFLEAIDADF